MRSYTNDENKFCSGGEKKGYIEIIVRGRWCEYYGVLVYDLSWDDMMIIVWSVLSSGTQTIVHSRQTGIDVRLVVNRFGSHVCSSIRHFFLSRWSTDFHTSHNKHE